MPETSYPGMAVERVRGGERLYDAVALILLMWPATGGMGLLGSTRVWGYAPGLIMSFLGSMLVFARPLLFSATPSWRIPPGFTLLALLCAYVAAGVFWVEVSYTARWEGLRWFCLLAAVFSFCQLGGAPHRWKWLLGILLMVVAMNGLYALVQHANGSRMVLWTLRPEQYGMRASGTYVCPNHFGNMLAMLMPLALVLVALPEAGFPLRLMSIYFLVVASPVLYWTQSRSSWLGMLGGMAAGLLLLVWRKSRKWFLLGLVLSPILAGAVGLVAWKSLPAVRERMGHVLEDPEAAGGIRMQMWRDAPPMFRDRPLWGFGGGSYLWVYPPYQRHVKEHLTWNYPHNEYIQLLLEYGVVGFALALGGLAVLVWGLMRAIRASRHREGAYLLAGAGGALAANLIHALFDFNFHVFPNPHALVWVGGVAWGVWYANEHGTLRRSGARAHVRRIIAMGGAVACGLAAWIALSAGMSYYWNLRGEMARTRLDWDGLEDLYHRSIAWDDLNWQPHLHLGHFKATQSLLYRDPDLDAEREGRQRLAAEAERHFRDALARNPLDMAAEFGLARALNARGDSEGALEHIRRAASYQQRHVFYREQLGIQLRRMGRDQEALDVFRQNIEDGVAGVLSRRNIRSLELRMARQAAEADLPATGEIDSLTNESGR